jgi:hypothetical protein
MAARGGTPARKLPTDTSAVFPNGAPPIATPARPDLPPASRPAETEQPPRARRAAAAPAADGERDRVADVGVPALPVTKAIPDRRPFSTRLPPTLIEDVHTFAADQETDIQFVVEAGLRMVFEAYGWTPPRERRGTR